ncbi:MAG: hypothetical protein AB8B78_02990 [Polaribacter sp.]
MIFDKEALFKKCAESLPEKQTEQNMFNMFLKMYPEEWKQQKMVFSKFNRSKQFGRSIPLPKPEVALRKEIRVWLKKQ